MKTSTNPQPVRFDGMAHRHCLYVLEATFEISYTTVTQPNKWLTVAYSSFVKYVYSYYVHYSYIKMAL
jgi:hypothetical protein